LPVADALRESGARRDAEAGPTTNVAHALVRRVLGALREDAALKAVFDPLLERVGDVIVDRHLEDTLDRLRRALHQELEVLERLRRLFDLLDSIEGGDVGEKTRHDGLLIVDAAAITEP
jgi:hypothetical protein